MLKYKYYFGSPMKSINIRPDDLPENFVTHISHMKTHDRSWHYDPSLKDNSALERTQIQIDDDVLAYLDAYSKDLPVEISSSIYDGEHHNYKANDSAWGKLDHVYHGYTEHNTQSRYMRKPTKSLHLKSKILLIKLV